MLDALKPLLDSGLITEDTKTAISAAWDSKINESRELARAELREEYARKFEHDKGVMVQAIESMVNESLTKEISEIQSERASIAEDRVKERERMLEASSKFEQFMVSKLAEEINEFRNQKKIQSQALSTLEGFVTESLSKEIGEFETDKRSLNETRVKIIAESKDKMQQLQRAFVQKSAQMVKEAISMNLETELTQLKEDVQLARENMFGRRLFEAFASEFAVTHLNENKEIRKLNQMIAKQDQVIAEAKKSIEAKAKLVESKDSEIRYIKESASRKATLASLLKPLNKEKAVIMQDLLESVQTEKLQSAFDKYLPAVLNQSSKKSEKTVLAESRSEVTGDKAASNVNSAENDSNVIQLKRLAGLK